MNQEAGESDGDWVALLGVKGGPAIYPNGSLPTSSLLRIGGRTIVVDCGAGVAAGITRQGVSLKSIDMIFVTHLHSDHYLDFGPLMHTAWTAGLDRPVRVHAPAGLRDYWQHFLASMAYDIETRVADEGRPPLAPLAEFHDLAEGVVLDEPALKVQALRNLHPPVTDSFALRFGVPGVSIVFSGDTAFFPPLAEFAGGADLLVHEALLLAGIDRLVARVGSADHRLKEHLLASHTSAEDVGRMARLAGVKALAIHHMVPIDDPLISEQDWARAVRSHWNGPLHVGRDGLRIPLSAERT